VRGFFFVDWGHTTAASWFDRGFYLVTALGHQAVMVFFVLSGFFIGGAVASAWENERWSWMSYVLNRVVRLEVVLLPALVLTLFWDQLGIAATGGSGYDGKWHPLLMSGPSTMQPADHSPAVFLANAAFLHTIVAPVYGTNGPLWSLANEFW